MSGTFKIEAPRQLTLQDMQHGNGDTAWTEVPGRATPDAVAVMHLLDRVEISDTVALAATLTDAREWTALRSLFAAEIMVDRSEIDGVDPVAIKAEELIAGWRAALSGYDATQHAISNQLTTLKEREAECSTYVVVHHCLLNYRGGDLWTLGVRHNHHLVHMEGRWKIASIKTILLWAEGNEHLPELAKRRFEEGLLGDARSW